ncbi:tRNA dihydrouridine synthase DusB [Bartonella sp. DGB2]|uniref:tRNA dihydrouridine synthase DusB n=1 Tax=Bartonella sp. DGB2 TaxID=3388426 RepID=UPI00398FEBDA
MSFLTQSLVLDGLTLRNRVFLAPMSGVSDLPFRQRCWAAGAGMVVSEMVASAELCKGIKESHIRLENAGLPQHIVQLAGCETEWIARAACIAVDYGAHMIDINMGCPAKKVTGGASGAALMRDVKNAMKLIESVIKVVQVPVSVKMRLGWDEYSINAPTLAFQAQQAGVSMITVHGRTRMQFYQGEANWDAIKAVRDKITIPLVVNGDICNRHDADKAIRACGADAVMIGRATCGQPWLFSFINKSTFNHPLSTYIKDHYISMLNHYGDKIGLRHARKHLGWYLEKHAPTALQSHKYALLTETDPRLVLSLIDEIFAISSKNVVTSTTW